MEGRDGAEWSGGSEKCEREQGEEGANVEVFTAHCNILFDLSFMVFLWSGHF